MPRRKTIREQSLEEILPYLFTFGDNIFTELEQTLLKEVLIYNKTFFDLIPSTELTTFRQKQIFNAAVKRLCRILHETGKKQSAYNKIEYELAEANEKLQNITSKQNTLSLAPELKVLLDTPIDKAGLSARVVNICSRAGIGTLFDLIKYSRADFLKHRDSGKKSADEVEDFLKNKGLFWKMQIDTM